MFDSIKQTLASTVNSVSGFVGAVPNAIAPKAHTTDDAAEPGRDRAPRSPRYPTATSRRATAAIDLTSPTRSEAWASPSRPKQNRSPSVASRSSTSRATPLPDPRFHFWQKSGMPKPGASHAPQPKNTLTQPTYRPPGGSHRTYGHSPRSDNFLNFLGEEKSPGRPVKKRKLASNSAHEISVFDEGDDQEIEPDLQTHRRTPRRSIGSGGSGSFTLPGAKDPRSEFGRTIALTDSRRKKARASIGNGSSGFAQSSAISIDDDDAIDTPDYAANPRKLQLKKFQQGVEGAEGKPDRQQAQETTSRHFAPKMNHSTIASDSSAQKPVRKGNNLRDSFSRTPLPESSTLGPWPLKWVRAYDLEELSEDLFLSSRAFNEFRITGSDRKDVKYEIMFKNFSRALTDHTSRLRLTGPMNTANNVQIMMDLEFQNSEDLNNFVHALSRSITAAAVVVKAKDFMSKIFQKPLAVTSALQNADQPVEIRDQMQDTAKATQGSRLLDNLARSSCDTGPNRSTLAKASTRADPQRLSERPVRTTRANQSLAVDLEEAEPESEVERYSQVHGLGAPWKKSLNYNSGRRRAVVDFKDLERLDHGEFLNDQLIDFYLLYLFDQANVPRDKVYFFNTHFFTTLTRKVPGQKGLINYKGVARWTARDDIFGYDYIVVPINQDVHWYLAIIANVGNIARTLAIEDLTKSDGSSETSRDPDNQPLEHEGRNGDVTSIPPPRMVQPSPKPSAAPTATEIVDPDDSDLNLVDPRATGSDRGLSAPSGDSSVVQSPAAETAQMKKLSINDNKTQSTLISSFSAGAKKPKGKVRPPPKKWDPDEPVIIVLDSLGGGARSPAVRALKEYILAEGQEKRGMEARIPQNACYAKEGQIPQQQNFSDCGVFLLGYAEKFFKDPDHFKRRLLSGQMDVNTDWPDMTMSTMRDGMREILQSLHKAQDSERVQAKKQKKQDVNSDNSATSTKSNAEQTRVLADKADNSISAAKVDLREASSVSETIETPLGHRSRTTSSVQPSSIQPRPRLASPFQPRSPRKRSTSRSRNMPEPTAKDSAAPTAGPSKMTPTATTRGESKSPIVLIPAPAKKSPKRSRETVIVEDSPEEITNKKVRPNSNPRQDFMDGNPRIVGVHSPGSKTAALAKRSEKPATRASPRTTSFRPKGTSRDPISLDDSQEALPNPTAATTPHSLTRPSSRGFDLTVTSPRSARSSRVVAPPQPARRAHQQQHMSSPVRSRHQNQQQRGGTSTAQKGVPVRLPIDNESPDPLLVVELESPRSERDRERARLGRLRWNMMARQERQEESSPEKGLEVPETPPHDG